MSDTADQRDAEADRHRVFFALWPDDATRAAISRATRDAVRASGGRPIAKDRLHLTVAFLGELTAPGSRWRGRCRRSPSARSSSCSTRSACGRSRRFSGSRLPIRPSALGELEARLWDALAEHGFRAEDRIVPAARHARAPRATARGAVEPVAWSVRELALVESFPDGRNVHYEVLSAGRSDFRKYWTKHQ